ncbi:MAG TPA: metallophosphoesterase [Sphingomonas sp.]|jgi:serine/threonine protein phosphatase 1|uniref:metallophosphoesterase n=1 Tax=Sphingomonas sp. TaxID=28214 RepID=UPI002ED84F12
MIRRLFRRRRAPAVPIGTRVYAIGDVHGRLDLLDALLDLIRADTATRPAAETKIIQLGDMIDRGPDSAGVVRRIMAGVTWADLTALCGNHEQAMLDGLAGDDAMLRLWRTHGGSTALASWGVDPRLARTGDDDAIRAAADAAIPPAERSWLATRPLSIRHGDYLFVHAGIRPGIALDQQSPHDMLWIRDDFLNSRRDHGFVVVHGHTVTPDVAWRANRIGIDTAARASDRLTALGLDGADRWILST